MIKNLRRICEERKIVPFGGTVLVFAVALFVKFYEGTVEKLNTTVMAFCYEYGFISRGFIGTIYHVIDKIVPVDVFTFANARRFMLLVTVVYFIILFVFFFVCVSKCRLEKAELMKTLLLFFMIFAVPMFITENNLGRYDIYCVMISLLSVMLVLYEKAEWLIPIFSAITIMIHQGNVFMFLNVILVLLFYKIFAEEGKKRKKYIVLFGSSFLICSALFLYFEFFSRSNGVLYYDDVVAVAKDLCWKEKYHVDVVDHEILGLDIADREVHYKNVNWVEFPIYVAFMSPYIILAVHFFKNVIQKAETKIEKFKYFIVSIGAATIIPCLILKCDFGRWLFAVVCYYCVIIIALLALKDKLIETELTNLIDKVKQKGAITSLLFVYPLLFQPFRDVKISDLTFRIADKLNDSFLHMWPW